MQTIKTILNSLSVYLLLFSTIALLLFTSTIYGQDLPCANEIIQTEQLKDTAFVHHLMKLATLQQNNTNASQRINGSILEIPIVVHVLHLGEPVGTGTNISDQQIIDAVQGTNERWRKINTTEGVDMEVEFCLAQFDPQGNPSNGIVRKDASGIPNYREYGISYIGAFGQPGADEIATKDFSNWPHDYVFNIWVVNKIAGGWGGYAFFPLGGNYSTDGVVIISSAVRYTSSTLAHELGHGMSLFHTFQGDDGNFCPVNDFCFFQGDWICDTPPHRQADCAQSNCNNSSDSMNSFRNTMSYCSGRGLFTQGQKDRVRTSIPNTSRAALLRSQACTGVTTSIRQQTNAKQLDVYPNPSNGNFTLNAEIKPNETAVVEMINTLGQTILQQELFPGNTHTLSLSAKLAKGIYVLQLKKEEVVVGASLVNVH
jgi:hypothetical protein